MSFNLNMYERALKEATETMSRRYRIVLVDNGLDVVPYLRGSSCEPDEFATFIEFTFPFHPNEYTGGYSLVCFYCDGGKERFFSVNIVHILEIVRADIPVLKRFAIYGFKEVYGKHECMRLLDWDIPNRNGGEE